MDVTIYNLILHLKAGYIIDGQRSSLLPAGGSSTSAGPTPTVTPKDPGPKRDQHGFSKVSANRPREVSSPFFY